MEPDSPFEDMLDRIGSRIYDLRTEKGEKLTSIAHDLGISHTVLSQIEHGRYKCLSFQMLNRIAAHFNKKVEDLISQ